MKCYKQIENGIEYDVFEFDEYEKDYQCREIENCKHSKIIRNYDTYKNFYYFRNGEAHNDFGPAFITEATGPVYYRSGDKIKEEEWKVYHRTLLIDIITNGGNELKMLKMS